MTTLCFTPGLEILLLCNDFYEVSEEDEVKERFADYKDENQSLSEKIHISLECVN